MFKKFMLTLLAMSFYAVPVSAADFPTKPITIVVPFSAGGETDIVVRFLAESMSTILGQNVAVQNIVGASGVTGIDSVIKAKPDGYTLCGSPSAPLAIHPHLREIPYKVEDMQFLGRIMDTTHFLVTPKNSAWNSIDDMVKDIKANPNKYFWASAGVGSMPYMALARMIKAYDLKMRHVGFTGDADAFQALAGNRAQLYTTSAPTLDKFDIKPLALFAEERLASQSNIPTFKELGKDITASQWVVVFAPKGTPADVVKVLENAIEKASNDPEFIKKMKALGLDTAYLNANDTKNFVFEQSATNAELLQELRNQ